MCTTKTPISLDISPVCYHRSKLYFRSGSTWVDATATLTKSGASEQDIEAEMKTSVFEAVKDLVATGAHDGFTFVQGDQNVFVNNPKPGIVYLNKCDKCINGDWLV